MRTAVQEPTSFETQLSDLQQMLWNEPDAVDCLIVAHDDPVMIRRLADAVHSDSVAVLPVRQADWAACVGDIVELAEDYEIGQVIFAGHSAGMPVQPKADVSAEKRTKTGLLSRVHHIQQQLSESRGSFRRLIREVTDTQSGRPHLQDSNARLDALFYVAASDLFLRFDPKTQAFAPLNDRS